MVYCHGLEAGLRFNSSEVRLQVEDRGFQGHLVNPAPGLFNLTGSERSSGGEKDWGGVDGGSGGCACQWRNWIGTL